MNMRAALVMHRELTTVKLQSPIRPIAYGVDVHVIHELAIHGDCGTLRLDGDVIKIVFAQHIAFHDRVNVHQVSIRDDGTLVIHSTGDVR